MAPGAPAWLELIDLFSFFLLELGCAAGFFPASFEASKASCSKLVLLEQPTYAPRQNGN